MLVLVAQGLSNAEISGRLFLSPATTKTHVSRILTKLGGAGPGPAGGDRLRERARGAGRELTGVHPAM